MRRRLLRALLPGLLLGLPLLLLLLAVETRPLVHDAGPPDARAAAQARDLVDRLRQLAGSEGTIFGISTDEAELNGALAAAQRVARGVEGRAQVTPAGLGIALSIGAPILPRGLWLNLEGELAPSEQGLELASARVGRVPLPPSLVLAAARVGLDYLLGDRLGSAAVAVVGRVDIAPPQVTLVLSGDPALRAAFFDRLKARSRAGGDARVRLAVDDELRRMRKASRRGELPPRGSVLPYLAAAVADVGADEAAGRAEMRGALYALALACGDPAFGQVVGIDPGHSVLEAAGCDRTTLAGRDDLKRHFVVSAGLYAATTSGTVAFGVGELKELLDSGEREGFSFEDMAADAAGVRFARALLAAPPEAWPAMAAAMTEEADLMPALHGLPEGLDAATFKARFGGVDSPEYAAVVAEIERRVAALPLYAAPPATN